MKVLADPGLNQHQETGSAQSFLPGSIEAQRGQGSAMLR